MLLKNQVIVENLLKKQMNEMCNYIEAAAIDVAAA